MKTIKLLQFGFLAAAIMASATCSAYASTSLEDLTKAKVVRIKGAARYTTGDGTWQTLKVGDILAAGTVIQTAEASRVDLVLGNPRAVASPPRIGPVSGSATPAGMGGAEFNPPPVDQNFIRIHESTVLAVDKLEAVDTGTGIVTDTQLDLRAGKIMGTVKRMPPGSLYEVKIPNGVAGIRGTVYVLSADGTVSVLAGSVVVAYVNADGEVVRREVGRGQQYDPRTDTISNLTPDARREIAMNLSEGVRPMRTATTFVTDDTELYISPTQGFNP